MRWRGRGRRPVEDRRPGLRFERREPVLRSDRHPELKDPNLAFDGDAWHLFCTGCGLPSGLEVLHATAPSVDGPWTEQVPVVFVGGPPMLHRAAPGVVAENRLLHLFLQQDFDRLGGTIEHYVSEDGGRAFVHADTSLASVAGTAEAGIYDPDPAEVHGVRFLTYAAMSTVGRPEVFLATGGVDSWQRPWERRGRILGHEDVAVHNQVRDPDYEWGLEGPQLVALPGGTILLTAVCFLRGHRRGQRQRVLFAVADQPLGPYRVLGPLIEPVDGAGENGHGCAVVDGGRLHLVYQERAGEGRPWHIRQAVADLSGLSSLSDLSDRGSTNER